MQLEPIRVIATLASHTTRETATGFKGKETVLNLPFQDQINLLDAYKLVSTLTNPARRPLIFNSLAEQTDRQAVRPQLIVRFGKSRPRQQQKQ